MRKMPPDKHISTPAPREANPQDSTQRAKTTLLQLWSDKTHSNFWASTDNASSFRVHQYYYWLILLYWTSGLPRSYQCLPFALDRHICFKIFNVRQRTFSLDSATPTHNSFTLSPKLPSQNTISILLVGKRNAQHLYVTKLTNTRVKNYNLSDLQLLDLFWRGLHQT